VRDYTEDRRVPRKKPVLEAVTNLCRRLKPTLPFIFAIPALTCWA